MGEQDITYADLAFPVNGIDVAGAYMRQRRGTSPAGVNVRAFEPSSNRARGGCRAGLSRYLNAQVAGSTAAIQELALLVGVGYTNPGGGVQVSTSGRVVTLAAVSGGNVYVAGPGATAWVAATNMSVDTPPLNTSGVIHSTALNQKLWFADGTHYKYYDPTDNTVRDWVATAGSLPTDRGDNTPRLIVTWRGRLVTSGLLEDGQNWFMSRVSVPTDYDTAPFEPAPDQAIFGNDSPLGLIGDVVTCLIPYTDDVLIVGGTHTIYQFLGDPMAGGQISLVTNAIGMAWGAPWCTGPDGSIYFLSNRTGIYQMLPGQGPPQRISIPVEQLLQQIDTGASTVRMIWDDRFQGLHVFISPTATQTAATHYFWEQRTGAWWQDTFANPAHNPLTCCVFDGNDPGDRRPLIGSWDGYVRSIDPDADTDDGWTITSSVMIGPILTRDLDEMILNSIQGVLAQTSGNVTYAVYVGATAELALASSPVATGTWTNGNGGRNFTNLIRRAGHAIYVKLSSTNAWALEGIRAAIYKGGRPRGRGV